mmetsp:Transcript_27667/g.33647  ORF Transcript_27667/g.33647 Transcript_27667/m.33647 type:complete len:473 (+) Transcript_27667:268-1686(+)|eukprot:CAMPEP_0172505448 /NCGR_PEP_ID=MMETSP1066-20121228/186622_1 /TAXON_ID=671091 /ORGANISM="Coscinodiscus wailesii, Strain CCMP2513" /LENGTH=472 /DNA_ID=CAMNT_0013282055 /DNA_START=268 /DNA_END=1686 /DNA_ORIENTATION=+
MKEMRRAPVIIFIVGIIFVSVQLSAVVNTNDEQIDATMPDNGRIRYSYGGEHDEMVDRPNSLVFAKNALRKTKKTIPSVDITPGITNAPAKRVASKRNNYGVTLDTVQRDNYAGPVDVIHRNAHDSAYSGPVDTIERNSGPVDALQRNNFAGPVDPIPRHTPTAPAGNVNEDDANTQLVAKKKVKKTLEISGSFGNYVDLNEKILPENNDTPYFWFIPMSGATTFKQVLGKCLQMTLPADPGMKYVVTQNIDIFQQSGVKYVTVDTANPVGIERGKTLNLLPSGKVDIVISPYIYHASTLFSPSNRGRMFTVIRHPIERAAAQYEFLKTINSDIAQMTLVEYGKSPKIENNWMTRFLADKLTGEVTGQHLDLAKNVLKTKCLIGLYDQMWATLKRFEIYFGWEYVANPQKQFDCRKRMLQANVDSTKFEFENLKEGTYEWTVLLWQNKFDLELYEYAKQLFTEQSVMFPEVL